MSYATLPARMDAIEKETKRLEALVLFLAQMMPPRGGEGAYVAMCQHCGKNALDPVPVGPPWTTTI